MTHRNHILMLKNAYQAIPDFDEPALAITKIFHNQQKPRLPAKELQELLDRQIEMKDVVKTVEKNETNNLMVEVYRFLK